MVPFDPSVILFLLGLIFAILIAVCVLCLSALVISGIGYAVYFTGCAFCNSMLSLGKMIGNLFSPSDNITPLTEITPDVDCSSKMFELLGAEPGDLSIKSVPRRPSQDSRFFGTGYTLLPSDLYPQLSLPGNAEDDTRQRP